MNDRELIQQAKEHLEIIDALLTCDNNDPKFDLLNESFNDLTLTVLIIGKRIKRHFQAEAIEPKTLSTA